jgi:hypothetical protein
MPSYWHDEWNLCCLEKGNDFFGVEFPVKTYYLNFKIKAGDDINALSDIVHFGKTLPDRENCQCKLAISRDDIQGDI